MNAEARRRAVRWERPMVGAGFTPAHHHLAEAGYGQRRRNGEGGSAVVGGSRCGVDSPEGLVRGGQPHAYGLGTGRGGSGIVEAGGSVLVARAAS